MKCPSCIVGTIKVVPGAICMCGHPHMVCDKCYHHFMVKHDSKNSELMPPEAEIEDRGNLYPEDLRKRLSEYPTVEEWRRGQ